MHSVPHVVNALIMERTDTRSELHRGTANAERKRQMAKKVKVSELVQQFQMEVVSGSQGLKRFITVDDLNRPGLEMAGYF
ncbi:HPr kinase/phosphorylase [compost metagenome]